MANIRHSVSIDAAPPRILPLISSADGFSQWWAADVSEDASGSVKLSFFKGATVYILDPVRDTPPGEVAWTCQSGDEWKGTKLQFQLAFNGKHTVLKFTHGLWQAETDYFVSCNTTWGALMYRLKSAAEGSGKGPLFTPYGME
jgi:uncharacterized protein YndB with AHSA1/START domain